MAKTKPMAGLVLTSGGARGAYQAGVLKALGEFVPKGSQPFPILAGVSAGSINSGFLAAGAQDFSGATRRLAELWVQLQPKDVFRTDTASLSRVGVQWMTDLSLGGFFGGVHGKALLDTGPLRNFMTTNVDIGKIEENIASGLLHGVAVSATNYFSGTAVTFYDGAPTIKPWIRTTRIGVHDKLTIEHFMASSAIPIFFPTVRLNDAFYGDGCIRLTTPLSPAIHMGADRVLAIGIRYNRTPAATVDLNRTSTNSVPMIADIAGVLLNSMFLDGLEADVERMKRINHTLGMIPQKQVDEHPESLRVIPVMTLQPSRDLGSLVLESLNTFPRTVRHLLRGLGASEEKGWDLLSYLAFDTMYTQPLVELGYSDGYTAKDELLEFLRQ
ncbi:MAG: patatin-like phospholipase family protein [Deltaproteobacteria bacterium]|nr:patatin-like phospholipase family protein [Deltaproteobacteria bacterium]